jgi:hypothetical protein
MGTINCGPGSSNVGVGSVSSAYVTIIEPYTASVAGLDAADSDIKDPAAFVASRLATPIVGGRCTHGVLQLVYLATATLTTALVVGVFGRSSTTGKWERLRNRAGAIAITITPDPSNDTVEDIGGTNYRTTTVDLENHVFDLLGNQEFIVGVVTALNLDGTNERTAFLRAKVI